MQLSSLGEKTESLQDRASAHHIVDGTYHAAGRRCEHGLGDTCLSDVLIMRPAVMLRWEGRREMCAGACVWTCFYVRKRRFGRAAQTKKHPQVLPEVCQGKEDTHMVSVELNPASSCSRSMSLV
ncbi:hypothetical protein VTL71DRAFT_14796 [Oculimacula yallundae]|uniref:Uncharacterized protein n=1 Tax=Oculimacula yallundae TaxID=86028 RepID=A0ABR4CKU6_9HELO